VEKILVVILTGLCAKTNWLAISSGCNKCGTMSETLPPPAYRIGDHISKHIKGLGANKSCSRRAALKREQWKRLESSHLREWEKRRHKQRPRERRNGKTPVGYSGRAALRKEQCNRFDQRLARQHLYKHGPTRNNRWGCFLCRPRPARSPE
jgi:hypothetical protein